MSTPSPAAPGTGVIVHTRPDLARPDVGRPDVGLVAISEFQVGGADQQQALFSASGQAWASLPWPETLLAITWLASTDGQRALAYAQWRDASQSEAFGRTHRPVIGAALEAAVPALEATPATFYRVHRSGVRPDAPVPGCVVGVSVEFDGPDEERQRAWIDAVFEALAADASPPAGGISGHFHVSTDGTRVFNYAEWLDEASHVAAIARAGTGGIGAGPKWQAVRAFPGVKGSRFTRYRVDRRLVPPGDSAAGVQS